MKNQPGGYDNNLPREQQASLTGFGARAIAGHLNSFEALLIFSTTILTALVTQNTGTLIQILAVTYLITRVLYHLAYLLDWASFRTTIWTIGLLICLSIIWMCIP
jgi:uncharacterized MAPEG superfamily protein